MEGFFCPVRASFAEAKLDRVSCTKYNLDRGYGPKSRNVFVGGFSCPARGFRIDYAAVTEQKSRLGGGLALRAKSCSPPLTHGHKLKTPSKGRPFFEGCEFCGRKTRPSKLHEIQLGSWLRIKIRNALCGGTFLSCPRGFRIDYAAGYGQKSRLTSDSEWIAIFSCPAREFRESKTRPSKLHEVQLDSWSRTAPRNTAVQAGEVLVDAEGGGAVGAEEGADLLGLGLADLHGEGGRRA